FRMHKDGADIGQMALVSTFSEYTVVPAISCAKIPDDLPLTEACLAGCGVPTGWGSAVNGAPVEPGDVTVVMGIASVGINAVQGALHAGASRIIAVDPQPPKREVALQLGATEAVETIDQAAQVGSELTNGQGADNAIVTVGVRPSRPHRRSVQRGTQGRHRGRRRDRSNDRHDDPGQPIHPDAVPEAPSRH